MTRKIAMLSGAAVAAMMLAATPSFAQQHPGQEPSATTSSQPPMTDQMQNQNSTTAPATQNSMSPSQGSMSSASTVALSKVQDPKTTLAQATVQDSSGTQVGQVQSVETSSSGAPLKVDITLQTTAGANRTVAIPASKLRFDQDAHIVKARLSQSEIEALQPSSGANPM